MPQILRHDGVPFVVYTYRELVTAKKYNLLKRELEMLAREHGANARFYIYPDGDLEAIFSQEEGYLLGENIWQHFGNPANLIYCEALADGENALLVVVKQGSIYLDSQLPLINLLDEFFNLIGDENQYDIYVYGDVPLAETATEEKFAFDAGLVNSFNVLESSAYLTLETDETLKLLPIDKAIDELPRQKSNLFKIAVVLIFLFAIGYGIWSTLQTKTQISTGITTQPNQTRQVTQNPYAGYIKALQTPAPSEQLRTILARIKTLLTIPGWTPVQMNLKGQSAIFDLQGVGGNTALLMGWVKEKKADLEIKNSKASIIYTLNIPSRTRPTNIYNLRDTVSMLYDALAEIFPESNVSIGKPEKHQVYNSVIIKFSFNDVSMQILALLADELKGFPVVINAFSLNQIDHGMVSGNIELEILGAEA
ncbi:MAG: hypothetical protein CMF49_01000 [Legionellales bacterium]|nr:hypothetical protein [Legionellales bacterium]